MCVENETITELEKEKKEIMEAVNIIKKIKPVIKKILTFATDIKMIHSMLLNHANKITEETEERKREIKRITDNYLDRFEDIKKYIKDEIKPDIEKNTVLIQKGNDRVTAALWSIFGLNIAGLGLFILNAIFKWIIF